MRHFYEIAAAVVLSGMVVPAAGAHEFWLEGRVEAAGHAPVLELDLKVGQMLDGVSLPFVPETFTRFEWVHGGDGPVGGTLGDVPAARVGFDAARGAVIFHRTLPRQVVHRDWALFLNYLEMEGLGETAARHVARGLPREGFTETYTRHAKLVVLPGSGGLVEDALIGSPVEFVLHRVIAFDGVRIIEGRLHADGDGARQVSVFYTGADGAEVRRVPTDDRGEFRLTVPGGGPVLLNAVGIVPARDGHAAWHSDWASVYILPRMTEAGGPAFRAPEESGRSGR